MQHLQGFCLSEGESNEARQDYQMMLRSGVLKRKAGVVIVLVGSGDQGERRPRAGEALLVHAYLPSRL